MLEKLYKFTVSDNKTIEKIVDVKHVAINHMILNKDDRLPLHHTNSDVHMIVARGEISMKLNEQQMHSYKAGSIIEIPYGTKMDAFNNGTDIVELFVVKSPSPAYYNKL